MNYQNLFNRDFYPTPKSVIDLMMQGEDVTDKIILEPSAGSGNIVQWLVGHGAGCVMACEINDTLRRSLRDCDIIGTDFLDVTSQQVAGIDYIVMNPPYLSGWKHLEHAYDIAPAGATIVCLLPWRDGYDFEKLEQWERRSTYDTHGRIRQAIALYGSATNIGDVFNNEDSERKHGYDIALVKIYKERNADEGEFDNYLWSMDETDTHCDGRTEGLMPYNEVYQLVSNYISAMRQYDVVYGEAEKLNAMVGNFSSRLKFSCSLTNDREDGIVSRARYKKELLKSAWEKVISVFDLNKYATSKLKEQINAFVERQTSVPFTMDNIYRMANMIIQTTSQRMETAICDAFDMICSFAPENTDLDKNGRANNVDAWKTNSDYMVNKKFIVPNIVSDFYGSKQTNHYTEKMADVIKALNYIARGCGVEPMQYTGRPNYYESKKYIEKGIPFPKYEIAGAYGLCSFLEEDVEEYGQWQEFGWFRVKLYKKGTMHFEFIGEEGEKIWALFNQTVAKKRGWRVGNQTTKARTRKKNNNNAL